MGGRQEEFKYSADALIRMRLPLLEDEGAAGERTQPRRLEVHDEQQDRWRPAQILRFAADGRVELCYAPETEGARETREWVDLAQCRYRWGANLGSGPMQPVRAVEI